MDDHKDSVYNLTKILAEEMISSVMEKLELEDTEQNRDDVMALALNYMPAKYVTTAQGKQYSKLVEVYRLQYESDVITALTKACLKVKGKPRASGNKEENS